MNHARRACIAVRYGGNHVRLFTNPKRTIGVTENDIRGVITEIATQIKSSPHTVEKGIYWITRRCSNIRRDFELLPHSLSPPSKLDLE